VATAVTDLLTMVATPAGAYVALFGLLVVDAFVPVVPTQAVMITAGALTVYGGLDLPLTLAVGAVAVFAGDVGCYLLGRTAGDQGGSGRPAELRRRLLERVRRGDESATGGQGSARRAAARFTRGLRRPGPLVLLLCRFVPGGRMVASFRAGRRRYPFRLYLLYDGGAAIGWATYGGLVGHIGGTALTQTAWRLFTVAAVAAAIFGTAGWVLAVFGGRTEDAEAADETDEPDDATEARAASADAPPPRSSRTVTGRS
jgi:membrane-associated protein